MTKTADKTAANSAAALLARGRIPGHDAELRIVEAGGVLLATDNRAMVRLDDHPELAILAAVPGFYLLDKDARTWRAVASQGPAVDVMPMLRASAESAVDPLSRSTHLQPLRLLADGTVGVGGRQSEGMAPMPVLASLPEAMVEHPFRGPLRLFGTQAGRRLAVADDVLRWATGALGTEWMGTLVEITWPGAATVRAMAIWTASTTAGSSDVWRALICQACQVPDGVG